MTKVTKTSTELSEIICGIVGIQGLSVTVRRDHALGWQPTVMDAPGNLIGWQRRVEEIAHKLRMQYDLDTVAEDFELFERWR